MNWRIIVSITLAMGMLLLATVGCNKQSDAGQWDTLDAPVGSVASVTSVEILKSEKDGATINVRYADTDVDGDGDVDMVNNDTIYFRYRETVVEN